MKTVLVRDNIHVKYLDVGSGPPIVMVHSGNTDHHVWSKQIDFFSQTHRVLALDLPGCGQSDKPNITYDLDLYVEALSCLVRQEALVKPVLFGVCFGGSTVMEYGIRHPDDVRCLIAFHICGGRPMMKESLGYCPGMSRFERWLGLFVFRLVQRVPFAKRRTLNIIFSKPPPADDELYQHLFELSGHPKFAYGHMNMARGVDKLNKFDGSNFERPEKLPPTYLFWGTKNKVLRYKCGKKLAQVLKPDRFTPLEGAGHMAQWEQSERANGLIQDFLSTVPVNEKE